MTPEAASPSLAEAVLEERIARPLWFGTIAVIGSLLLTLSAKVSIGWPVPMTMQTFVVLVIGLSLGSRLAGATVALYLVEGAVGLPVFAGTPERGIGLAYMAGPTGGYLAGFLVAAIVLGVLAERGWGRSVLSTLAAMAVGTVIIFALGLGWLAALIGVEPAIANGLVPFLVSEPIKIALACAVMPLAWRLVRPGGG